MRYFLTSLILSTVSIILTAQVQVGMVSSDGKQKNFTSTDLIRIKNSRVIIDVPASCKPAFQTAFQNAWTISEFAFADEAETSSNGQLVHCGLSIRPGENRQNFRTFCEFTMKNHSGKNIQIASLPVQLKPSLNETLVKQPEDSNLKTVLYKSGEFHNLHPSFLTLNLKAINNTLSLGKTIWFNEDVTRPTVLSGLAGSQLFIPTYCLLKPDYFRGTEEIMNKSKLLKKYSYSWKSGSTPDTDNRFIFLSAQTGSNMYISIIDNLTGQVIYQNRNQNQYYLKRSDFKNIAKAIG
ncbi:MAG TPA: hypothetical protein VJ946_13020 [Bacteroidales bacterium]|nr:hypothetical protein [Bacteroidales bacterium]